MYISSILIIVTSLILGGCEQSSNSTQGYVEGKFTYVAANFAGILQQLPVQRGSIVKNQQPLFILEQQPESDAVMQARAQVNQVQAQKNQVAADLSLASLTLKRQQILLRTKATQQETYDTALANFQKIQAQFSQAEANLTAAQAALAQAQWSKQQKTVFSPKSAIVFDTYFLPGELVPAAQPVLSLLAPNDIKIVFFVPEIQLNTISLNQLAKITCDSGSTPINAKISFISPQAEYMPQTIYSETERAKLVYRIEAEPSITEAFKLHPGQPVTIYYGK